MAIATLLGFGVVQGACATPESQQLRWTVRFACEDISQRAARVSVSIAPGECTAFAPTVYETKFARGQALGSDDPGALPAGRYAFRATAFDSDSAELAQVCRVVDLPSAEDVVLELVGNTCASDANEVTASTDGSADAVRRPDAEATACRGASVLGLCWYLSAPGESCVETCRARGGTDPHAKNWVGTPSDGGSAEACQQIFDALGYPSQVMGGQRDDGLGLGCHRWENGVNWWLGSPAFDETSSLGPARVVCACRA